MVSLAPALPSLRDKIAQMLILGFDGTRLDSTSPIAHEIKENKIGGVVLFDYDCQTKKFDKNILNTSQVSALTDALQARAKSNDLPPLFIGIDYEGGEVNRLKETNGFCETRPPESFETHPQHDAKQYFFKMAEQLKTLGINLNFAPSVDLANNPDNPIIAKRGRSFSASADKVIFYTQLFAEAFKDQNILYALKHFPGHGSSHQDSHLGFVDVSETWSDNELHPYQTLMKSDTPPPFVMTAHIVNKQLDKEGLPATLSKPILTGLLRETLAFKGLIVSDDMQMGAITDNFTLQKALILAINAGVDCLVFGNQLSKKNQKASELLDIIEDAVQNKQISLKRIDKAYKRIIQIKKTIA
jgi:beta-N-acetylhexosaminidase